MAYNISGTGAWAQVGAKTITEFADDNNPFEVEDLEVSGQGVNLQGTMVYWAKGALSKIKISVIPHSDSDEYLRTLLLRTKPTQNSTGIYDFQMTLMSGAGGKKRVFTGCVIMAGPPADGIASEGRLNSHTYTFVGEEANTNS